ncbi:MAG: NAD(P)H-dependent oxidoreductase [Pirellulaceae bacterium]
MDSQPISPQQLLQQLQWRYATKQFDPKQTIPEDLWGALETSLVLTPSSYGMQPWRFWVITDPKIMEKLPAISWNQTQPRDCSHMLVLATQTNLGADDIDRWIDRIVEVRQLERSQMEGFRRMLLGSLASPGFDPDAWAIRQVYIALGQFMAAAALLGIDTCPMEGIDSREYDQLLGIPAEGFQTVVACAAGYRDGSDRYAAMKKVRYPADQIIRRID